MPPIQIRANFYRDDQLVDVQRAEVEETGLNNISIPFEVHTPGKMRIEILFEPALVPVLQEPG